MTSFKKALRVLGTILIGVGFLIGIMGSAVLKGLGYSMMMFPHQPTQMAIVENLPAMANPILWLSLTWPLWLIVGTGILVFANKLKVNH
jgi:hypothetical protein